jgi:endonuclease/exonuclease/phosphatase family metal-dependent hydrolase
MGKLRILICCISYAYTNCYIKINMKLITLNIWGGRIKESLLEFIKNNSDVDIFCLQEVYHNAKNKFMNDDWIPELLILSKIQELLPSHNSYFRPVVSGVFGNAILIKNDIQVLEEGEIMIHENLEYPGTGPTHSRNLQYVHLEEFTVINIHGLWNGKGKNDCEERILQSMKIKEFMNTISNKLIVAGDFNLNPNTESLKIIDTGMNNLIEIHDIQSTRTKYYKKEGKFADYIITSSGVNVSEFRVLNNEVSDHSPLLIDFS